MLATINFIYFKDIIHTANYISCFYNRVNASFHTRKYALNKLKCPK